MKNTRNVSFSGQQEDLYHSRLVPELIDNAGENRADVEEVSLPVIERCSNGQRTVCVVSSEAIGTGVDCVKVFARRVGEKKWFLLAAFKDEETLARAIGNGLA